MRYLIGNGIKWRWREYGLITEFHSRLRDRVRQAQGRTVDPTAAIIDSQSVRAAETLGAVTRGWDNGKRRGGTAPGLRGWTSPARRGADGRPPLPRELDVARWRVNVRAGVTTLGHRSGKQSQTSEKARPCWWVTAPHGQPSQIRRQSQATAHGPALPAHAGQPNVRAVHTPKAGWP